MQGKRWEKSFHVVLIPPLEGVLALATLEEVAVLSAGFIQPGLIPAENRDKTVKPQHITSADVVPLRSSVCRSTGNIQDFCESEKKKKSAKVLLFNNKVFDGGDWRTCFCQ